MSVVREFSEAAPEVVAERILLQLYSSIVFEYCI